MHDAPNIVDLDFTEQEIDLRLNAFILYEDVAAGKRAKETCDVLDGKLGPGWKIEIGMSSFKCLRLPEVRQLATEAVHSANLVIFSCYDGHLPLSVRDWTEFCWAGSGRSTSLVALIAGTARQTAPARAAEEYLADVAQRHGLKFFSHFYVPVNGTTEDRFTQQDPNDDGA
jgi:hypothetical protein